jgi:hypothetical protein
VGRGGDALAFVRRALRCQEALGRAVVVPREAVFLEEDVRKELKLPALAAL